MFNWHLQELWKRALDLKDGITKADTTIDYAHHEIHDGHHFYMEGYAELGAAGTLFVKLVTPAIGEWAHFKWEIDSVGVLTTTFDEDATGGMVGATSVIPINNNRNSTNASKMVITTDVTTCTGYGTRISNQKFGFAENPSKATGGGAARDNEVILKQNAVYCRSFTSGSANNIINFRASWYEHTNV